MEAEHKNDRKEQGQILILFAFLCAAVLLCLMAVVDVGFFLRERQQVQKAADAAALAGAQELPDDPTAAEQIALEYVEKNGLDPDDVTITFSCTSDSDAICQDGDGRYDTIRVTPNSQAPSFFGGVLSVIGIDTCWVDGCTVDASAAGCRGACGPIGTGPADIMVVLDHSYSMTTSDLANAKNATLEMLEDFDHTYQQVGLGVTPPVNPSPGDTCDAINSWDDSKEWMPSGLTTSFQTSPHVLNSANGPVYQTNCLDRTSWSWGGELTDYPLCYCHTDVGSSVQAAANELALNGRADVTWGMIVLTDGASNVAPYTTVVTSEDDPGDTGWNSCDDTGAVTSNSGDNNGFQSGAGYACSNGGSYATDDNSGTNTSTSCTDTGKDRHVFYDYDLDDDIPGGSTINGIEVRLDAWATGSGTRGMCVELSSNGGSTWTSPVYFGIGGSEQSYYLGGSTDLWGRSWDENDFSPSDDFRVRVTNIGTSSWMDFRLDYIAVKVHYTSTSTSTSYAFDGSLGPCDWAVQQATYAKSLGIEIYVIGYGLNSSEHCYNFDEDPSSPYYSYTAAQILEALATDAEHFYNEPASGDLEPVFQAIGAQLTGGSRLVE